MHPDFPIPVTPQSQGCCRLSLQIPAADSQSHGSSLILAAAQLSQLCLQPSSFAPQLHLITSHPFPGINRKWSPGAVLHTRHASPGELGSFSRPVSRGACLSGRPHPRALGSSPLHLCKHLTLSADPFLSGIISFSISVGHSHQGAHLLQQLKQTKKQNGNCL